MTGGSLDLPGRIVVVDDDPTVADVVGRYLVRDGHCVESVSDGYEALALIAKNPPDLVVLDLMLPGIDGLEVCRRLRARWPIPVVMLTALGDENDRLAGFEIGADDYVTKPFNPRELLARIRAVLRRAGDVEEKRPDQNKIIRFGGWTLEPARRRLMNPDGVEVPLTGGEYDLLVALVDRANRVLTRDMLLDLLRGRQAGPFDRAIDVAISRLRRKLEDDGRNAQLIKTVRGGGYVLAATVERA